MFKRTVARRDCNSPFSDPATLGLFVGVGVGATEGGAFSALG